MSLAISTSWFARRFSAPDELLGRIEVAGFRRFELGAGTLGFGASLLPRVLRPRHAEIVAIEDPINGVPAGEGGSGRHLGALDEGPRRRSIERALETAAAATAIGCRRIVLQPGAIATDVELQEATIRASYGDESRASEWRGAAAQIAQRVETRAVGFLDRLCRSLFDLCRSQPEIHWCLCPGRWPSELGRFDHLELIFEEVRARNLFYWHDTGAAEIRRRLGESGAEQRLDELGPKMAGLYLRDVEGLLVGRPPGSGEIDFQRLASLLPSTAEHVLRLDPTCSLEELRLSQLYLDKYGF